MHNHDIYLQWKNKFKGDREMLKNLPPPKKKIEKEQNKSQGASGEDEQMIEECKR